MAGSTAPYVVGGAGSYVLISNWIRAHGRELPHLVKLAFEHWGPVGGFGVGLCVARMGGLHWTSGWSIAIGGVAAVVGFAMQEHTKTGG